MRIVVMLGLAAACGAPATTPGARPPLANQGGAIAPGEPATIRLDAAELVRKAVELDRVTPATVTVVSEQGYGTIYVDGRPIGPPPQRFTLPAGHHMIALMVEGY
jgi:hypothetical protein